MKLKLTYRTHNMPDSTFTMCKNCQ